MARQHHARPAHERTLARYIADLAVTGLTSNPTIFDKALTGSADYDEQIRLLLARGTEGEELFFELALLVVAARPRFITMRRAASVARIERRETCSSG